MTWIMLEAPETEVVVCMNCWFENDVKWKEFPDLCPRCGGRMVHGCEVK